MRIREAIVLAGGLGTRLREVLPDIPKCMADVNGKPFLSYVLDYLIDQDIEKVILSVGYRKDQIINYFGDSYQSLSISYSIENEPLGTGGAIKQSINYCNQDEVFVLNGDTYFIADLEEMEETHFKAVADITIAVKHISETCRYGLVIADQKGRITDFREKDPSSGSGLINCGIYLINRKIFDNFPEIRFSMEHDVFKLSCSKLHMQAFETDAFFLDMGIPEDYIKAQMTIKSSRK